MRDTPIPKVCNKSMKLYNLVLLLTSYQLVMESIMKAKLCCYERLEYTRQVTFSNKKVH